MLQRPEQRLKPIQHANVPINSKEELCQAIKHAVSGGPGHLRNFNARLNISDTSLWPDPEYKGQL